MPKIRIRMVWWDYGRVPFDYLGDELMEGLSQMSSPPISPVEVYRRLQEKGVVKQYDLGAIRTDEFLSEIQKLIGFRDIPAFIKLWNRTLQPNRLVWKAVEALRRNSYLQGVISNTNELQADYIEKVLACGNIMVFRPRIYSYREGILKPDPLIYQLALRRANEEYPGEEEILPKECVFIDDRIENVEAARVLGWYAIHHSSFVAGTLWRLTELGVKI